MRLKNPLVLVTLGLTLSSVVAAAGSGDVHVARGHSKADMGAQVCWRVEDSMNLACHPKSHVISVVEGGTTTDGHGNVKKAFTITYREL